jgi:hypothetical protein
MRTLRSLAAPALAAMLGVANVAAGGGARAAVFEYSLPGGPLVVQPIGPTEEFQASFAIPETFIVQDVNLTLHNFSTTGGLVSLIFLLSYLPQGFNPNDPSAPDDTTVVLAQSLSLVSSGNPPPPSMVNGTFTFDDEALLPITAITPFTPEALALREGGTFRPQGTLSTLDGFSAASFGGLTLASGTFPTSDGAWVLTIRSISSNVGATAGEFESATLTLTGALAVPAPAGWAMMPVWLLAAAALTRRATRG